ncbi:plastocyanin/azurin family copper-binding protein [Streptomyces sp. NPDC057411]|uniref:plastocyanin/azurin family copper-binding protein n=1 Tax=unclassified Streptomyces TaxID=2593676 RepID=UPI00362B5457
MTGTMNTPRTSRIRGRVALGLSAGALAALLAACGDGGGGTGSGTPPPPPPAATTPGPATPANPGTTQVKADLADFRITLSQKTFEPGAYSFTVKNTGHHDHALEIEGPGGENKTKTLGPGESDTLKVTLKSGTYEVYCPVDGHKDMGMKTEISVGGATDTTPGNGSGNGY